jgi:unsaturated rhamnogalacturonyl hydrolase
MRIVGTLLLTATAAVFGQDRMTIGLTRSGLMTEAIKLQSASENDPTVLLIGGFTIDDSARVVKNELNAYAAVHRTKRRFNLIAVPNANPGGAQLTFPPAGAAYMDDPDSHYLWRWTGVQAPDLILIAGEDPFLFAHSVSSNAVAGFGSIPARRVDAKRGLLSQLDKIERSKARQEKNKRQLRSPLETARLLEAFYGHDLATAVYVPGMALMARIRMGNTAAVQKIVAPFVDGSKDSLAKPTSSHLSGHLVFGELAEKTGDKRYTQLLRRAADLGFNADGSPKESMPFHDEMSDSVFMGCPILAKAGKLTGNPKYFDMALRHFRYMAKLCRRDDHLYRHSPLHPTAWGRGNAFPALGLALTLADLPKDHPAYQEMLGAFRELLQTLSRFQDPDTGMWRQAIDHPGAYPEFSATAMIARSMLMGIRNGWLDEKEYRPRVQAAWKAVLARISDDGQVVDVCESTGKQDSLEKYLARRAILGIDARGAGMAMMLAVEMAGLK